MHALRLIPPWCCVVGPGVVMTMLLLSLKATRNPSVLLALFFLPISTRCVRRADCNDRSQIWWTASMISCPTSWPMLALSTEQHCRGNWGQADPCVPHSEVPCLLTMAAAGAWGSPHTGPHLAGVLRHLTHSRSLCLVLRSSLFPSWHNLKYSFLSLPQFQYMTSWLIRWTVYWLKVITCTLINSFIVLNPRNEESNRILLWFKPKGLNCINIS